MAVSSISNSINKAAGKVLDFTATKKLMVNALEKGLKNPAQYASKMFLISIVSKDFINTCLYTYQSLNNDKIPKEKRSFVAANDLVLGFFNFFGQIGSYLVFERYVTPWLAGRFYTGAIENKKTGEFKQRYSKAPISLDSIKQHTADIIQEKGKSLGIDTVEMLKPDNLETLSKEMINEYGYKSSRGKALATGVGVVVTALATTALIKRTVSTIFSTPIAGKISNMANKRDEAKEKENVLHQSVMDVTLTQNGYKDNQTGKNSKIA